MQVSGHRDLDSNPRRAVDWLPGGTSLDPLPQFLPGEDAVILARAWTEMKTRCKASPLQGAPGMSPRQSACRVGEGPLIGLGATGQLSGDSRFMGGRQVHRDWQCHVVRPPGVSAGRGGGMVTGGSQQRAETEYVLSPALPPIAPASITQV